ncbi:MAG: single-stranded DNA-binding protein, partial [Polyangiaceae bacterium]
LVRDPEIRYINSGAAVTKFTLAVNRRSKQQEETDFIDCVAWDKLAETCNTYLKKGMSVLVDGRLSIRSYETKEGEKRKASEVVVNVMQMLDRANRGYGENGSNGNGTGSTNGDNVREFAPRSASAGSEAELEDEIPF